MLFIRNYTLARTIVRVGKEKEEGEGGGADMNTDLEKGDVLEGERDVDVLEKGSSEEGHLKADGSDEITMRATASSATSLYKEKSTDK